VVPVVPPGSATSLLRARDSFTGEDSGSWEDLGVYRWLEQILHSSDQPNAPAHDRSPLPTLTPANSNVAPPSPCGKRPATASRLHCGVACA
jgi:hypothetical protein